MTATDTAPPEEFKDHIAPGKDWKEIVAWVGDLPPLPHVAARAIGLIEDPDTTAAALSNLLGQDPALAARVLKIANSAMFSRTREITTINHAIMLIGFKALKGIIVAATLRQLNRKFGPIEKMVWENSVCTAIAAHTVAKQLRKAYVDECFLLGLLHDLGKLVLMRQIPDEFTDVVNKTKEGSTFMEIEQEALGFGHQLIGALVAKKWNFSMETCQVILHHHDEFGSALEGETEEKTAIIQFADLVAHEIGYGHMEGYPETTEQLNAVGTLIGLNEEKVTALLEEVREAFEEQGSVF